MKKILVHLHLYYQDMWPEYKGYLNNISSYECDVFVTLAEHNSTLEKDIMASFPNAHIVLCENRGYDIRPFIQIIQSISLINYSYIIKLHTKRDVEPILLGNFYFKGKDWRVASNNFISSKENITRTIDALEQNSTIGMCGSYTLFLDTTVQRDTTALKLCDAIVEKNKLPQKTYIFVVGTIFIARAEVFDLLQYIDIDAFERENKSIGQYAHAVERFFGYCVYHHGLIAYDPLLTKKELWKKTLLRGKIRWKICRFFYMHERNSKGKMRLKICKIPLPIHLFTKE